MIAKPAEETPLIALEAVRLMHEAGVPQDALQLLPGDGAVGAALTDHASVAGVMFTGSTEVARLIAASLAKRLGADGAPIPLIAETGGQNALIVDSSALAEQVVGDALASAFDSAGQRCSALRVLCLQDDIADRTLAMLKAAMRELEGRPARPAVLRRRAGDFRRGACAAWSAMSRQMRAQRLSRACGAARRGMRARHFLAPTLIEISAIRRSRARGVRAGAARAALQARGARTR